MSTSERTNNPNPSPSCLAFARCSGLSDPLSGYVTALIRYDLAHGGPHNECNGSVRDKAMLAELDELTAAKFAEGKIERIRLIA